MRVATACCPVPDPISSTFVKPLNSRRSTSRIGAVLRAGGPAKGLSTVVASILARSFENISIEKIIAVPPEFRD